jgi:predicted AAA+ superfamily ATPase
MGARNAAERTAHLYLFDPGVARALKGHVAGKPSREELGALFEGWVVGLLRAYGHHRELFEDWAYWSPADARTTEVDVVLRRGREYLAIEAKLDAPRRRRTWLVCAQ